MRTSAGPASLIVAAAVIAAACSGGGGESVPGAGSTTLTSAGSTAGPGSTEGSTAAVPDSSAPETPAPPTSGSESPATTSTDPSIPAVLEGLETAIIEVGGVELFVVIADTEDTRVSGLMHVEDLESLDGMLFVWSSDTTSTFWMSDTLISLDIAWFDAAGAFVSSTTMTPCESGTDCVQYSAAVPYRYALEMAAGDMERLGPAPSLVVPAPG